MKLLKTRTQQSKVTGHSGNLSKFTEKFKVQNFELLQQKLSLVQKIIFQYKFRTGS